MLTKLWKFRFIVSCCGILLSSKIFFFFFEMYSHTSYPIYHNTKIIIPRSIYFCGYFDAQFDSFVLIHKKKKTLWKQNVLCIFIIWKDTVRLVRRLKVFTLKCTNCVKNKTQIVLVIVCWNANLIKLDTKPRVSTRTWLCLRTTCIYNFLQKWKSTIVKLGHRLRHFFTYNTSIIKNYFM